MAEASTLTTELPPTLEADAAAGGFVGRFGLDPWLLLAQVVNFLVVLYVLRRFVFVPVLRMLRARAARIDRGLKDAEAAQAARAAAETQKAAALHTAALEAADKLRTAAADANRLKEQLTRQAEAEAAAMHDRAEREAERLRADALASVGGAVGELVVDVATAVLAKKLTDRERAEYRAAAVDALRQHSP